MLQKDAGLYSFQNVNVLRQSSGSILKATAYKVLLDDTTCADIGVERNRDAFFIGGSPKNLLEDGIPLDLDNTGKVTVYLHPKYSDKVRATHPNGSSRQRIPYESTYNRGEVNLNNLYEGEIEGTSQKVALISWTPLEEGVIESVVTNYQGGIPVLRPFSQLTRPELERLADHYNSKYSLEYRDGEQIACFREKIWSISGPEKLLLVPLPGLWGDKDRQRGIVRLGGYFNGGVHRFKITDGTFNHLINELGGIGRPLDMVLEKIHENTFFEPYASVAIVKPSPEQIQELEAKKDTRQPIKPLKQIIEESLQ